jgi:hypothetical protein
VGLLRLFIAWRLLRFCLPLILSAALLLTVSSSLRRGTNRGKHAATTVVSGVEHQLQPLIRNARRGLAGITTTGRVR